ncbi:spore coat U domain-containing protein [Psychrobacter glacincola]|uniref:Csu type fimbrial protein n=1 Tax=Psychrobacter glacincola TaxID=56810 RepID=UPI0039AE976D
MDGGSTNARQGVYTNNFGNGNHTALTFRANENLSGLNCATGAQGLDRFPFTVQAAIEPSCAITATSDVNLGPRSASETNITGSNSSAITVNCTDGGSYYIGLKPFNNSTTVAGVMSGTGGNLDKVPYQLRSTAGINGTIWGNTATSTTVGNGVADFGTGSNKTHEVFITVPTADFKPDNYSDTVTINVNY